MIHTQGQTKIGFENKVFWNLLDLLPDDGSNDSNLFYFRKGLYCLGYNSIWMLKIFYFSLVSSYKDALYDVNISRCAF